MLRITSSKHLLNTVCSVQCLSVFEHRPGSHRTKCRTDKGFRIGIVLESYGAVHIMQQEMNPQCHQPPSGNGKPSTGRPGWHWPVLLVFSVFTMLIFGLLVILSQHKDTTHQPSPSSQVQQVEKLTVLRSS